MRTYEVIYIISPNSAEDEIERIQEEFRGMMREAKAELTKEENWGKRKLTYEIGGFKEGVYIYNRIEGDAALINVMERKMRHSDAILKYLSVRIDEDLKRAMKLAARRKPPKIKAPAVAPDAPAEAGEETP